MISKIFNATSIYKNGEEVLLFWQKKIFNALFSILLVICIIPYILSCKTAFETSEWNRFIFYTLIYIWAFGVTFLRKIPFHIRVWAGISGFFIFGIFSLVSTGLIGSSRLYFLCFSAFAAIFSGMKGGLFTLVVNMITLSVFGYLHFKGLISLEYNENTPISDQWSVLVGTFFFLCTAVTLSLCVLAKALELAGKEFKEKINENHKNDTKIPDKIMGSNISPPPDSKNMSQEIVSDILEETTNEKRIKELEKKLAQAEKHKAMGILAGSVAHDLNNILSGIATYPEVLMMDEDLDPNIVQGLNMIKDSGQKASAVVSDLLTISRGSSTELEIINLNSILDRYIRAHDFNKIRETYHQVTIETLSEPELLNIKGSYIHIEKTIMNLVLNAVEEVSGKDDGSVLITTSNGYIDSSLPGFEDTPQGEYVILSVIDNGSGIDDETLKKIFDPFFTKKEMEKSGTGLGLTVVWNAVQDHNGFIKINSNEKGTKFDLLFPAIRQEIPKKEAESSLDEIKGQGQTILIVDDLKDQQKIAITILRNLGYSVKAVDNGYLAVEYIRNNPTDLVILDMIMTPSISGLETYRLIKKINPGQKAIIASGYSESEDVLSAQDLGAGSFVKKPYTILDMGIAIKEELED